MAFATTSSRCPVNHPLLSPQFSTFKYPSPRLTISTSRKHPPFSLNPLRFQISARFGRPTKRQNHLRKKQQVTNLPPTPVIQFDDKVVESDVIETENLEKRPTSLDDEIINIASGNGVKELEIELEKKPLRDSIYWSKLESWVEQYKKDSDFWGVGNGTIFTITRDAEGKVEKVMVNEDEILKRCRVNNKELEGETGDFEEAKSKISFAHGLASDMESGSNVIPENSTVAKFSHSELRDTTVQSVKLKTGLFTRMSKVGLLLLCGLFVVRVFFTVGGSKRGTATEKEQIVKGNVEVVDDPIQTKSLSSKRPQLDKEQLVNSINQVKGLGVVEQSGYDSESLENKIAQIREMARNAREVEKRNSLRDGELEETDLQSIRGDTIGTTDMISVSAPDDNVGQVSEALLENNDAQIRDTSTGTASIVAQVGNMSSVCKSSDFDKPKLIIDSPASDNLEKSRRTKFRIMKSVEEARAYLSKKHQPLMVNGVCEAPAEQTDIPMSTSFENVTSAEFDNMLDVTEKVTTNGSRASRYPITDLHTASESSEKYVDAPNDLEKSSGTSNHEVRTKNQQNGLFMHEKHKEEQDQELDQKTGEKEDSEENERLISSPSPRAAEQTPSSNDLEKSSGTSGYEVHAKNQQNGIFMHEKHEEEQELDQETSEKKDNEENERLTSSESPGTAEQTPSPSKESWIENNFHEFEPIVKKIRAGFQDNYQVARQKASNDSDLKVDMILKSDGDESEFEWMKDEKLLDIVFKVRDNELSGRDPFHNMNEEDKQLFFCGLEKRVEQENEKLQSLHEYFHSNIENLDYGAEGISLFDPPEKIIPRWKVPPADKDPEFLNSFLEQRKSLVAESLKNSVSTKKKGNLFVDKSGEPSTHGSTNLVADASVKSGKVQEDPPLSSKTVIQGSDGSVKAGKKSGTEFWQHTKKWSQGFLESYNAETDPEVKSVMKDIGKDLDRWITEKEIQEAAAVMDKLPEKGQKFVNEKLYKVKREMELFGPQAVVSKYREYADEKEEDYLWWLDLPYVMCIELYTVDDGEQRVGFYSLEMAVDLELDPKQYHVLAFEDASDCKNLCYIIQAHMELLGNGNAFVVARPPKDAFREAKDNGFSVTVIRNGQLQLNIDQTLEEVELLIQEIGSKVYQDKLMKERSVDINAMMKGVFGISKPTKRNKRSKRKPKRGINPG